MSDEARADDEQPPVDETDEQESWLREAVRVPGSEPGPRVPVAGDVIGGKYVIEAPLGRGGMGVVFRARQLVSEKPVAIKWMLRAASDPQARRRFAREARAAGRIDHPNVVDLYDVGQDGDSSYLVMELLRGESLRERLKRGPLSPEEAVELLVPAMTGVAAVHRAGVVHRDLKPDNVFLCQAPDGSSRGAKVLDFGVSTIASPDGGDSTLTQEGTLLGSPAYMSPEQLRSAHDVDVRTDVYGFGVILYEALTGAMPFQGNSYSALILAITSATPTAPSALRPELSPELERVVMRAIARERDERFADMDALIAALQALGGAGLALQPAPAVRGRAARWVMAVAAVCALLVAVWLMQRARGPDAAEAVRAAGTRTGQSEAAVVVPEVQPVVRAPTAPVEPLANPVVPSSAPATEQPPARSAKPAGVKKRHAAAPRASEPAPANAPPAARSGRLTVDDLL